jgi:hypothetical protein
VKGPGAKARGYESRGLFSEHDEGLRLLHKDPHPNVVICDCLNIESFVKFTVPCSLSNRPEQTLNSMDPMNSVK